ncbi:Fur-regulated basic protein FbpA [Sutcliffiella sp. NC1]|nr:Fur-regulated basic protein FbpA [Sutcliffiella sp. NC1]WBL17156.1 Fur-regulated basic protein FbpA [Sutcliffiella sp. NC1]
MEIISKLLEHHQFYKKEDALLDLTLSELEYEYYKVQSNVHPHTGFSSIRLKKFS